MVIEGEWRLCDDGATRPVVRAQVEAADGSFYVEHFLVDSCADRTVFSADLFSKLAFSVAAAPSGGLQGIGGVTRSVRVQTLLTFATSDGGIARVRGEFAAFVDPAATDLSILGRDVLDNFDVIISRPRDQVVLLAQNHCYRIERV